MNRWTVEPARRDGKGRIRWYRLRWLGAPLAYLTNGYTCGLRRFKRDAAQRTVELTAHEGAT